METMTKSHRWTNWQPYLFATWGEWKACPVCRANVRDYTTLWANQHGECRRYFCACNTWFDIRATTKRGSQRRIGYAPDVVPARLGKTRVRDVWPIEEE